MNQNQSEGQAVAEANREIDALKAAMATVNSQLQDIGTKMDVVIQMQISITQLQERHEGQRLALDRAFTSISATRDKLETVTMEQSRAMSFVKGGTFVAALLFAFAQWYMVQQIAKVEKTADSFMALDRRLVFVESKVYPDQSGRPKDGEGN